MKLLAPPGPGLSAEVGLSRFLSLYLLEHGLLVVVASRVVEHRLWSTGSEVVVPHGLQPSRLLHPWDFPIKAYSILNFTPALWAQCHVSGVLFLGSWAALA